MVNYIHKEKERVKDMAKSKLIKATKKISEEAAEGYKKIEDGVVGGYKKIEDGAVGGYKKIEDGVVGGYKKIEDGVVGGFNKIADKFVDQYLTEDGESVEEARIRLTAEKKSREEKRQNKLEKKGRNL